ncbi:hypothetical protein EON65_12050 [archaeon]|nr:MAG: hypothetical protein EON65_12050 [archaeon]
MVSSTRTIPWRASENELILMSLARPSLMSRPVATRAPASLDSSAGHPSMPSPVKTVSRVSPLP